MKVMSQQEIQSAIDFYNAWSEGEIRHFVWASFFEVYGIEENTIAGKAYRYYCDTCADQQLNGYEIFIESLAKIIKYHRFI